jgi:hypothetical protein
MTRGFTGAIVVCVGLSACAQLQQVLGGGGGPHCTQSNGACPIDVVVPSNCTQGSCVAVRPDPTIVGGGARDVHLKWTLPQGYSFCDGDAIKFKGGPGNQFSEPQASGEGRRTYQWKDANTAKGPFPYAVRFHDKECRTLFEIDPVIVNDM